MLMKKQTMLNIKTCATTTQKIKKKLEVKKPGQAWEKTPPHGLEHVTCASLRRIEVSVEKRAWEKKRALDSNR